GGGDEIIGITASKETDFPAWYQEVVLKAELIEYYNEISGFFILMPTAMYIWKIIRSMWQILHSVHSRVHPDAIRLCSHYQIAEDVSGLMLSTMRCEADR